MKVSVSMNLGRLKKSWEFKKVYRHGKALASRNIVLYFFMNNSGELRVGFSISKKIGNSVERHRVKRIYREALYSIIDKLKSGLDFIVVARKPAVKITFHQAREEMLFLCRKGRLLR